MQPQRGAGACLQYLANCNCMAHIAGVFFTAMMRVAMRGNHGRTQVRIRIVGAVIDSMEHAVGAVSTAVTHAARLAWFFPAS